MFKIKIIDISSYLSNLLVLYTLCCDFIFVISAVSFKQYQKCFEFQFNVTLIMTINMYEKLHLYIFMSKYRYLILVYYIQCVKIVNIGLANIIDDESKQL